MERENKDVCPVISHIMEHKNTSVYQWRTGNIPTVNFQPCIDELLYHLPEALAKGGKRLPSLIVLRKKGSTNILSKVVIKECKNVKYICCGI